MITDDMELVRNYARQNSEEAFATLVTRHINLVYSVAWRQVHDLHLAEEITQAVFVILAQKAKSLGEKNILSGWLCRTARYVSANALTIQRRRQRREQESYMQTILNEPTARENWEQIAPMLEAALARLNTKDHDAIVLRFFEGKDLRQVGAALGTSEEAAKKRVSRALEKLRHYFVKHGVDSTAATIADSISANSVQAAPMTLAKSVTTVALAKGAAASTSTLTLIKGALKIMAWTKAKTAVVATAVALLMAGTATVAVRQLQEHEHRSARLPWQVFVVDDKSINSTLKTIPPQVKIVPTAFPNGGLISGRRIWAWIDYSTNGEAIGMNCTIGEIMRYACSVEPNPFSVQRTIVETHSQDQGYDFIANLENDSKAQLQLEIKNELGIVGRMESRPENALALTAGTDSDGIEAESILNGKVQAGRGRAVMMESSTAGLAKALEQAMNCPVVDQTGISNHFDLVLRWTTGIDGSSNEIKKVLLDHVGLELVPTNMPLEMLVVEKAK